MLTKEQRAELAAQLDHPYGPTVHLLCDGRRIALQLLRESGAGVRYRVFTYIDGEFRGAWVKGDTPEAKFLRKRLQPCCSKAQREKAVKALGKRYVDKSEYYNKVFTYFVPDWPNGKAAINHLCKVCESVEIAPPVAA